MDSILQVVGDHFHGQLVIYEKDSLVHQGTYGYADRIYQTPTNDSTRYEVGGISEVFTYYFIEHLAGLQQIKVSDPVVKYIKNFPYKNIRILDLINHKSGLPQNYIKLYHKFFYQNMDIRVPDKEIRFSNTHIINLLSSWKGPLSFEPGTKYEYNKLNYLILGSLIETITFTPMEDFVQRIFEHQHFTFRPYLYESVDTIPNRSKGYLFSDSTYADFNSMFDMGIPYDDGTVGHQHLFLTANQLALWGRFYFPKLDFSNLPSATLQHGVYKHSSGHFVYRIGGYAGNWAAIFYSSDKKIMIALTSNVYPQNFQDFEEQLIAVVQSNL